MGIGNNDKSGRRGYCAYAYPVTSFFAFDTVHLALPLEIDGFSVRLHVSKSLADLVAFNDVSMDRS